MAGKFPRSAIVWLALAALLLTACDSGMKIGGWQITKPKAPLVATRIEVVRWRMTAAHDDAKQAARTDVERLAMDLITGRASFTDSNGKIYPQQLSPEDVQKINDLISGRSWQTTIDPDEKATDTVYYSLTVYNGEGGVYKEQGLWAVPSEKPLPDGFVLLDDAFEQATRLAHPLSEEINLLK